MLMDFSVRACLWLIAKELVLVGLPPVSTESNEEFETSGADVNRSAVYWRTGET